VISCFKPFKVFLPFKQSLMSQTLEELMAKMFVGKAGWWRDYFDLTTAFTDTTGTTAISAMDQTYALHLDKSRGLALGTNLITNGDFNTDVSGWTLSGTAATFTWVLGAARLTRTGTGNSEVTKTLTGLTVGNHYLLETNFLGSPSLLSDYAYIGIAGDFDQYAPSSFTFQATSTTHDIHFGVWFVDGAIGDYVEFDNISVREIPGIHASQATGTARLKYKRSWSKR